jgi:hypothetical protein
MGNCSTARHCLPAHACAESSPPASQWHSPASSPTQLGDLERPQIIWHESVLWPDVSETVGLTKVAECCQPLLFEIVGFLAESPKDFAFLCGMSARFMAMQMRPVTNFIWKDMYAQRWPAFHECMQFKGIQDWCNLYRETLNGRMECTLEVFDREKKLGFAMAAMPARIQYEARCDCYVARYLSASEVPPEKIPSREEHRLRFCPESVRSQLLHGYSLSDAKVDDPHDKIAQSLCNSNMHFYPYRVLQGFEGLQVGAGVELQWKMQEGSPFGWWYGQLDALTELGDGLAQAIITFRHFPSTSRWYRLGVVFGDSNMRDCAFGGYTGGIRSVSEAEKKQCMKFFPKEPVVF